MSFSALSYFDNLLHAFTAHWQSIPKWARLGSIVLAISATSLSAASLRNSYRKWKALGAGGLPYNWKGYMMNIYVASTVAYTDTTSLDVYDNPAGHSTTWSQATESEREAAFVKFLKTALPRRRGPQARAKPFVIPQREKNEGERIDEEVKKAYLTAFDHLQIDNANATEWKTSVLEKRGRALFLKDVSNLSTLARQTQGEICHVHGSDLSGHVTLSYADAREVLAKGWGERHRLSGTKILPLGYTMTFVPRDQDEVQIYTDIFQAGIDYMQHGQ